MFDPKVFKVPYLWEEEGGKKKRANKMPAKTWKLLPPDERCKHISNLDVKSKTSNLQN